MKKYTIIPDVLTVESNADNLHYFSFGFFHDLYKKSEVGTAPVKARFTLVDRIPEQVKKKKFDYYFQTDEGILYDHGFLFGKRLRFLLRDSEAYDIDFVCERDYYNLIKLNLESVAPPALVFFRYILSKMLEKKILPLHCSAFNYQGQGNVLIAASNTGKSFTAFSFVEKKDAQLLTEDVLAFDGRELKACHSVSVYSTYINNNSTLRSLLSMVPYVFSFGDRQPFYDYFTEQKYKDTSALDRIFIIERGDRNSVESLDPKNAVNLITLLNEFEFNYIANSLYMAEAYFKSSSQVETIRKHSEKLIEQLVKGRECYYVNGKDHEEIYRLVQQITG